MLKVVTVLHLQMDKLTLKDLFYESFTIFDKVITKIWTITLTQTNRHLLIMSNFIAAF